MLPVLHRRVPSVSVGGCHGGWDVWSITDLVTVGNSDMEQVGECCYNATDVLKTVIKTNLCLHLTSSSDTRDTDYEKIATAVLLHCNPLRVTIYKPNQLLL